MTKNDEKIKQLISAYFDGEATPAEKRQAIDYLKKHPEYTRYYQDLLKLSSSLGSWEDEALSPDSEQKIKRNMLRSKAREGLVMKKKPNVSLRVGGTLVAGVLVLMVAIQVNTKMGIQGRLRSATDDVAGQIGGGQTIRGKGQIVTHKTPATPSGEIVAGPALENQKVSARISKQRPETEVVRRMAVKKENELAQSYELNGTTAYGLAGVPSSAADRIEPKMQLKEARARGGYQKSVAHDEMAFGRPAPTTTESLMIWPIPPVPGEDTDFNTEQYDRIYENDFLDVTQNPLSTFSIDVDTASYSNLRRFLNSGSLPPKDAVRIEEMVNYFVYDYPQPKKGKPFSITTEIATCPWNTKHQLALIGLQGQELTETPPSNLVFLIDVSGSMNQPNKLPLLKQAYKMMVQQLRKEERIAIVTYAGSAGLVLKSTPGSEKREILRAIDNLSAGGSTAGGEGIELAYKIAKENFIKDGNNRVILATDGDFNVGVSSDGELTRIIEEKRQVGIFLTVLGFGTGNYKDAKMEKIADKGNGNYYYIDTINEAKKVLVHELGSMLFTIAKDVKIQIEFNPQEIQGYRLIGYENRLLKKEDFNDDTKDAGELGAGHTVTALYELIPTGTPTEASDVDALVYQKTVLKESADLMTVKLRYKNPDADKSQLIKRVVTHEDRKDDSLISTNFHFAAAVAEFGLLLRDSKYKGNASMAHAIRQAQRGQGKDVWGYRSELIHLMQQAEVLIPAGDGQYHFKGKK